MSGVTINSGRLTVGICPALSLIVLSLSRFVLLPPTYRLFLGGLSHLDMVRLPGTHLISAQPVLSSEEIIESI